jgi:hypothetical protein
MYRVDKKKQEITLIDYAHHDEIYWAVSIFQSHPASKNKSTPAQKFSIEPWFENFNRTLISKFQSYLAWKISIEPWFENFNRTLLSNFQPHLSSKKQIKPWFENFNRPHYPCLKTVHWSIKLWFQIFNRDPFFDLLITKPVPGKHPFPMWTRAGLAINPYIRPLSRWIKPCLEIFNRDHDRVWKPLPDQSNLDFKISSRLWF